MNPYEQQQARLLTATPNCEKSTPVGVGCIALVGVAGGACDRNVESVRAKLYQRAARGLSKYGVTTERTDLDTVQWLRHAQEEALDLAVYLERLIADHEAALAASPPTDQIHP